MLINLRNALMAGKRLPYDAEVEFLESTGTQWIDTGLPIAPNFYLDATFSIPSSIPHVLTFMGTTTQSQPYYRFWVASIQTNKTINCGLINNALSTATLPADEPHNIYVKFFDGEQLCKLDGTTIVSATNTSDSSAKAAWLAQGNLFIGRSSLNEQFNFIGKVFAVKIYDANGVLVRDFIPVRMGSGASAVGYLYDRVSGKLFGNAGTGDFALGQDVVPVEYIESHGTEWIDTGILGGASTRLETSARFLASASNNYIGQSYQSTISDCRFTFGVYAATTNWYFGLAGYNSNVTWRADTDRHSFALDAPSRSLSIDGVAKTISANAYSYPSTPIGGIALFGRRLIDTGNVSPFAIMQMWSCKISDGEAPVRSFRPVRVGTEGAMMDVLTRRIYRNNGTGAFTYGNDLKYPIPSE